MSTPCVLELEGVPVPVWQAEFTQIVIVGGSGGGPGGPAAWGSITGTLSAQVDLSAALAGKLSAASNLGDLPNTATARSNLGLGSAAQSAASSFATATQGGKADTALQPGAGLSAIDSAAATKLAGVQAGAQVNAVSSVAGKTGAVTLAAGDISGLGAMATKSAVAVGDVTATGTPSGTTYLRGDGSWSVPPAGGGGGSSAWGAISGTLSDQTDLQTALNAKANTASLAAVATAGTYASLTGKPTLGTAAASNVGDFAAASHSHAASAISDSTATGRALLTTANAAAARSTLGLGSGATSAAGDFATAAQGVKADSAVQPAGLAPYAKTADLPPVPTALSQLTNDAGFVTDISGKQDVLVSGSNIKTVNGQSLLGAGDLVISGGGGGGGAPCAIPLDGWFGMVYPARPGTSGIYSYSTIGVGSAGAQSGATLSTPQLNSSSLLAATPRISLTSAAAANSGVDFSLSGFSLMRGASPGHGGFVIKTAFAVTSAVATQRFYIATITYVGNIAYISTLPASGNAIGIGFDAALHSNYQLMHGGGGALTYVDLGPNFPISNTSAIIDVEFRCPPNGSSITYLVKDRNSGLSAAGTFASNLPTGSSVMVLRSFMNNGGAAAAVSYDLLPTYYSSYWSA